MTRALVAGWLLLLFALGLVPGVSGGEADSFLSPTAVTAPDIETFMQIGSARSPAITPDGQAIFLVTDMSGVGQLYRLTEKGWPYQLTAFRDGIDFYAVSPLGDRAVVGVSRGGDEQSQLALVDTATGGVQVLTRNPTAKHGSPVWSPDGRMLFFNSNEVNGRDFYVYAWELNGGRRRLVFELEGANEVADVSPDGGRLVIAHYRSGEDSDLYLVELASLQATHLTPHKGEVFFVGPRFSADVRSLYLITNQNAEGIRRLAILGLTTREITFLDPRSRWEVEDLVVSPGGRYLAWVENEEGYARARLRDLAESANVPLPSFNGMARSPALSRDGALVFVFDSPTRTGDIWGWDRAVGGLRQLTFSTYAGVDRSLFREPELVSYPSFDGREIPAFLYLPAGWNGQPLPFVMEMHGGPESQFRPGFNRHFQYLLLNGYGLLAPNVRGSSGYGREYMALDNYRHRLDAVRDAGAGARWLMDKGYTDSEHLAVKGESYGGYMTLACLAEFPDLFAAGVDVVGIADFVTFLEHTKDYRRALREAEYGPLSDREFLRSISPLSRVDRIRAPLLVVHGENDPRVPVGEARQIVASLAARGREVESLISPDEGHGVAKTANRLALYRRMVDFLDKHLKDRP